MEISERGLEFIKRWEGFRPEPYRCAGGVWTIGYGRTEGVTGSTPPVDEQTACRLLEEDLSRRAAAVSEYLPPLRQEQVDAVLSFCYNCGVEAFARSGLCRAIRRDPDDYRSVAGEFRKWNKSGGKVLKGLVARREAEIALYCGQSGR